MKAIVSLATDEPHYYTALERLQKSLRNKFDGDFLPFMGEKTVCAPKHRVNNYAFKIFALAHAKLVGFTKVFWLDSSCYAVKDVQPIFGYLDRNGIFLEDSGHSIGAWSNDETLQYFKITRDDACKMPMLSGGFIGLDFNNRTSQEFFYRWQEAMCMGLFNGSRDNHRHDQTCASIIAHQMHIPLSPNCTYFAHVGPAYAAPKETAVFHLQGI